KMSPSPFLTLPPHSVLCLVAASSISPGAAKEQRVWAKVGDLVVLPCQLSPQELQSSWKQLREGGGGARARSMMPRASVRKTGFRQGDFSLLIEPLLRGDAGHYEALVRYGKETRRCRLELGMVTVTVNPPGLLVETEPLLLHCNSSHPAKLVGTRWFHNGSLVPVSGRFRSRHWALSISRPTVRDSGPWSCELTYSDDEKVSATFNLPILGFAGPASPVVYAAVGSATNLPCLLNRDPSASGILGVSAHWSRLAGGDLEIRGISKNGSKGSFTLHLPVVWPGDAGQYCCAVSIHGTTITRDVTLAVMTGEQGKPRGCQGDSSPPVAFIGLEKNLLAHQCGDSFEAMPRSPAVQRYYLGSTMELTRVSQKDIGTWECSVHGSEGRLGAVEYELYITGTVSPVPHSLHSTPLPSPCAPRLLRHLTHLTSQHFPNLIHTPN
uniref:Lymphocyte activation gene 3 protein n=1 Tax=Chelydra serpentina TaxID=8475 RepID=A0A8C3T3R9_CHESE